MVIGLAAGAVAISYIMSTLFRKFYTGTFSVIFGLFLSMIPNMLNERCTLNWGFRSVVSILVMILGFGISYYLGDLEKHNQWIREHFAPKKKD